MAEQPTKQVKSAASKHKPPAAGRGRARGSRNKLPAQLKDMIIRALDAAGGEQYLLDRALDPRTAGAFLTLLGKVLPMQVTGVDGGAVELRVEFVRTVVDSTGTLIESSR